MAGLYRDPPIHYKRAFDSSKPKLVTLTVYNKQDQEDSVKVPLFTGVDLEELLHTEEAFRNAARDLELPANKYIRYLGRCLSVDAQTKWRSLTKQGYSQTLNGYKQAFSAFIKEEYCNAEDAKDIMHAYLRSAECKKPSNVSCKQHADRMEQLFKYTSKLQGYGSTLSNKEQRTILLHSFPNEWINDYGKIHRGIKDDTTAQFIVDHMSCLDRISKRKSQNPYDSDINSVSNQSCDSDNNSSASDNASNADSDEESDSDNESNQGNNNRNKRSYNNPCRIPGHDHDWSECPKNRYSKRNKSNSSNNSTASAPSNETGSTAPSNESFQAHMRRAMESYCTQHDGTLERTIEGTIIFKPKRPRYRGPPITMPPAPPDRQQNLQR
mmetsp:Transcript_14767/g.34162  ORF Transcript_14767/g.34162 Transcript_14767/m.34162 type:complete len:382 (-) Transcript_14767:1452-2597(-)